MNCFCKRNCIEIYLQRTTLARLFSSSFIATLKFGDSILCKKRPWINKTKQCYSSYAGWLTECYRVMSRRDLANQYPAVATLGGKHCDPHEINHSDYYTMQARGSVEVTGKPTLDVSESEALTITPYYGWCGSHKKGSSALQKLITRSLVNIIQKARVDIRTLTRPQKARNIVSLYELCLNSLFVISNSYFWPHT